MDVVGQQFADNKIFVPKMLVSAVTMKKGFEIIKPLLKNDNAENKATVLIGTVKGDMHDISKNLVSMMMEEPGSWSIIWVSILMLKKLSIGSGRKNPMCLGFRHC